MRELSTIRRVMQLSRCVETNVSVYY